MYGFILNMYVMRRITADKVASYSPFYITALERDMILATPQNEI